MYYIFFTGTAGSGKTTMVNEFQQYLLDQQMDAAVINLDPAVERLPYTPDLDIRDYVDAREVMEKYGLGPNSSLIVSMDLLMSKASEVKKDLGEIESNYVIIDTPGQVELFAYRDTSRLLVSLIVGESKAINIFLLDSFLARDAESYVSLLLLSSSIRFRMSLPQINVLSKIDLLSNAELEKIKAWGEGEELIDNLGKIDDFSFELVRTLVESLDTSPIPVSATEGIGMDELYAEVQRTLAGGEDYYTEENSPR
ncbi:MULTISPECIES: ATP/GTP-binding protein [Acidianus]|uniref:GTPase n=1 Tax=Candidatus Acidianus copahuensis TaxID=1160895 RepID=A0A031LPL6_9CREN|nr:MULTISPECIES: ATP/GTP-binding protein [Acidianus]EZQ06936.1 GTPase [Candidatus Acidianus copahuensis]NON62177.1 GTPase [Acidianus sp. RZ1]